MFFFLLIYYSTTISERLEFYFPVIFEKSFQQLASIEKGTLHIFSVIKTVRPKASEANRMLLHIIPPIQIQLPFKLIFTELNCKTLF